MSHDSPRFIGCARPRHVPVLRTTAALWAIAVSLLGVLVPGSARADDGPLRVVATTPDLGALTRAVGGDDVSITVLVKGAEDPHFAEAKPSYVRAMNQADLFIQMGLALETGYAPLLLQQCRNPRIAPGSPGFIDASTVMGTPLDVPTGVVDRSMGDVHPGGNPHYLLDPLRGLSVARLIATRLGQLRPERRASFEQRFETFQRELFTALVGDTLATKYGADVAKLALLQQNGKLVSFLEQQGERADLGGWFGALLPYAGTKAVDDHPIWSYFADRFGLRIVGHLEPMPGVPPTTKHLEQIIELIRAQDVKIVLASAYYDPRYAKFVSEKSGASVLKMANQVDAAPGTESYVGMIDYDVRQVVAAMSSSQR